MATLNKVMLIGRLTKDPDPPRQMGATSSMVVKFRLAVGRSKKNPETGAWENDPNPLYIDCEAMTSRDGNSRLVDLVKNYLRKGSEVFIEGRLTFNEWEKDGQKMSAIRVNINDIQFVGARSEGGGSSAEHDEYEERPAAPPARRPAPAPAARSNGAAPRPSKPAPPRDDDESGAEEDIPF